MTHLLILKSSSIWSRLVIFGCISWEHIIWTICAHHPDISYKNHTMIWRSSYHYMILIFISWCFLPWQPNNFLKAYLLGNQGSSPWRWSSLQCDDDHIIRYTTFSIYDIFTMTPMIDSKRLTLNSICLFSAKIVSTCSLRARQQR